MIKVVFTYKTKKEDLPELMNKFQQSSASKFHSEPSNTGISMYKREEDEFTFIILDVFYNSVEDYHIRTAFERSQDEWNEIWFSSDIKHEEVSVEIFDVLRR